MLLRYFSILTSFVPGLYSLVTESTFQGTQHDLPHKIVYQFDNNTWVENLAVRANSNILVTLITSPQVWEVDPSRGTPNLVKTFPDATSALGIAEVEPEVFVVAVGNWSIETFESTPGSYSVWKIDYRASKSNPAIHKITDVAAAGFLNGMTTLPTQQDTVLIADSYEGVIYALNTETGVRHVVVEAPELKPKPGTVAKLGVNGIHYRQSHLYFANSFKVPVLGRFLLHPNGTAAGAAEIVLAKPDYPTNTGSQADDFTFDKEGNIWLTTDPTNTLLKVDLPSADVQVVAGGTKDPLIAGNTAAAFGRTQQYEDMLFVTTNGGLAYPTPGGVVGGKIVAFDTGHLYSS